MATSGHYDYILSGSILCNVVPLLCFLNPQSGLRLIHYLPRLCWILVVSCYYPSTYFKILVACIYTFIDYLVFATFWRSWVSLFAFPFRVDEISLITLSTTTLAYLNCFSFSGFILSFLGVLFTYSWCGRHLLRKPTNIAFSFFFLFLYFQIRVFDSYFTYYVLFVFFIYLLRYCCD